jgi:hypothetical protein
MGPLKKRMREAGADDVPVVDLPEPTVDPSALPLESVQIVLQQLREQLKLHGTQTEREEWEQGLLALKTWQRAAFAKLHESERALQTQQDENQRQQRLLASLRLERTYLSQKIQVCKDFQTPNLLKMAQAEVERTVNGKGEPQRDAITAFLQADVHDPSQKQEILARLQQELNVRGGLERDVKLKQQELKDVQLNLQTKTAFLTHLPDQLAAVERVSKPLQKFVATSNLLPSAGASLIGSDRLQRLELARSLSPPLYTVFHQLQTLQDKQQSQPQAHGAPLDPLENDHTMQVRVTATHDHDRQVLLQLMVPDLSSSSRFRKCVLHFHYSVEHNVVTVLPTGCNTLLFQDVVLDDLFPDDRPDAHPDLSGKPYHWCNYMAGLHVAPSTPTEIAHSVRVIVQALQRRLRANATLKYILSTLQRKSFPVTPGLATSAPAPRCSLTSLVLDKEYSTRGTDRDFNEKQYLVVLRNRNEPLEIRVRISWSRYPSVPPVWLLSPVPTEPGHLPPGAGSTTATPVPLYDDRLALLERHVNEDGLQSLLETTKSNAEEVTANDASYTWILMLQLREIMLRWDTWCDGGRPGENGVASDGGSGNRVLRGRDRRPVAL